MHINFNAHSAFVSFYGQDKTQKRKYTKITEDPQVVRKMYIEDGISKTAKKLDVSPTGLKNFLVKHGLIIKNKRPDRTRLLMEDRKGISVDEMKEAVLCGYKNKDLAEYFGVSPFVLKRFFKEHKDEINYLQLKKQARNEMIKQSQDAVDLSEKMGVNLEYANNLRNKHIDKKETVWEQKRAKRLQIEIPMFEQQAKRKTIAEKTGIPPRTIDNDRNYYIAMKKGILNDRNFIKLRDSFSKKLEPAMKAASIASWDFYINSTDENRIKLEQKEEELYCLYRDEDFYNKLKSLQEAGLKDEHLNKQLKLLVSTFEDEINAGEQKKALREKENEIAAKYNSYVPQIDGKNTSIAEIRKILEEEKDVSLREKAYNARIQGGNLIADELVELVKMRNEYAKSKGYDNFFEYALKEFYEVDADELQKMLDEVYEQAKSTNAEYEAKTNKELAEEFGVSPSELKSYHYGLILNSDPEKEVSKFIKTKEQVVDISKRAYKNMGYDVDKMPIEMDLFPRKNKNTHCFGFEIEAGKDTRILANLTNNTDSIGSLLHELGHCVYFLGINTKLPYLDKGTHAALTEAVAMMMEDLPYKENVMKGVVPKDVLEKFKADAKYAEARFINRSMQIISFEKAMYENPDQDLAKLWHDVTCKYLGRNENIDADNDWATVPHFLSYPGYYQNYFRADLMKAQMYNHLKQTLGDITENKNTAEYLNENLFKYGICMEEDEIIKAFTKEPLSAKALCENLK